MSKKLSFKHLMIASATVLCAACSNTNYTAEPVTHHNERGAPNLPEWWIEWRDTTEASRETIQMMTYHANLRDTEVAFERFISTFDDEVEIYGLASEVEGKEIVEEHYYPVFYFLKLALVNDMLVASGDRVMERYHAWRSFPRDSEPLQFDGCEFQPSTGAFSIRGYTLFQIRDEKIIRRYSNHDHGYRMAQTCGESAAGDAIKAELSGGFADDNVVYDWGDLFIGSMSHINESAETRPVLATQQFAADAVIHGIGAQPGGVSDYQAYLSQLWASFPDLIYHSNGAATAWGNLAINYQAAGSHRAEWLGIEANHQPVMLKGEIILRFNQDGLIEEAWVYDHLDKLMNPYF